VSIGCGRGQWSEVGVGGVIDVGSLSSPLGAHTVLNVVLAASRCETHDGTSIGELMFTERKSDPGGC
jgi:hypothetical protein